MKRNQQIMIALALAGSASVTTMAYETLAAWPVNTKNIRAGAGSFAPGSSFRTALEVVIERWNLNPSPFRWDLILDDTSVSRTNNQNEIWFEQGPGTAPAECLQTWDPSSGEMVRADVIFYHTYNDADGNFRDPIWDTSTLYTDEVVYNGDYAAFHGAALHELGHALGLKHENDEYNLMGDSWTHLDLNGDTMFHAVGEDAADGAVALYGLNASASEDLAVTHWKWTGRNGEYSTHGRTKIYQTNGQEPIYTTDPDGSRRYILAPGTEYQVEFTYQNNGKSTLTEDVAFYLSTNQWITTGDTYIATRWPTIGRGDVYTTLYTIRMPSSASGDYYLGVRIDSDESLIESGGSNNAAWIAVHFI